MASLTPLACLLVASAMVCLASAECIAGPSWTGDRIILAFADGPRRVALANWAVKANAAADARSPHPVNETIVVCTDDEVLGWCKGMGLECRRHNLARAGARGVWRERARMMVDCVEAGFTVMIQDLDAIWRKDPRVLMDSLHETEKADVVGARGFYPHELGSKIGATLCMGFTQYYPTVQTKKLLRQYLLHMASGDYDTDQRAMNHLLFDGVAASSPLVEKCGSTKVLSGANTRVALLSAPLFTLELCWDQRSDDAYMLHPGCLRLDPGTCLRSAENKMFALAAHGLFDARVLRSHECLRGTFTAYLQCLKNLRFA